MLVLGMWACVSTLIFWTLWTLDEKFGWTESA